MQGVRRLSGASCELRAQAAVAGVLAFLPRLPRPLFLAAASASAAYAFALASASAGLNMYTCKSVAVMQACQPESRSQANSWQGEPHHFPAITAAPTTKFTTSHPPPRAHVVDDVAADLRHHLHKQVVPLQLVLNQRVTLRVATQAAGQGDQGGDGTGSG